MTQQFTFIYFIWVFIELFLNSIIGDVETYIDNIGRYVLKSTCVTATKYKKARVFTTGIHIKLNDEPNLHVFTNLSITNQD